MFSLVQVDTIENLRNHKRWKALHTFFMAADENLKHLKRKMLVVIKELEVCKILRNISTI